MKRLNQQLTEAERLAALKQAELQAQKLATKLEAAVTILFDVTHRSRKMLDMASRLYSTVGVTKGQAVLKAQREAKGRKVDPYRILEILGTVGQVHLALQFPAIKQFTKEFRLRAMSILVYAHLRADEFGIFNKDAYVNWSRRRDEKAPSFGLMGRHLVTAGYLVRHGNCHYELTFEGREKAKMVVDMFEDKLKWMK